MIWIDKNNTLDHTTSIARSVSGLPTTLNEKQEKSLTALAREYCVIPLIAVDQKGQDVLSLRGCSQDSQIARFSPNLRAESSASFSPSTRYPLKSAIHSAEKTCHYSRTSQARWNVGFKPWAFSKVSEWGTSLMTIFHWLPTVLYIFSQTTYAYRLSHEWILFIDGHSL